MPGVGTGVGKGVGAGVGADVGAGVGHFTVVQLHFPCFVLVPLQTHLTVGLAPTVGHVLFPKKHVDLFLPQEDPFAGADRLEHSFKSFPL